MAPLRFALHEIVEAREADGFGVTPLLEANPPVRPGAMALSTVQLVYARCKARFQPATSDTGQSRHTVTSGAKFAWTQSHTHTVR